MPGLTDCRMPHGGDICRDMARLGTVLQSRITSCSAVGPVWHACQGLKCLTPPPQAQRPDQQPLQGQQLQLYMVQELMHQDLWGALGDSAQQEQLQWYQGGQRIALDIARGLAMLHQQHITHLDIK